MGRHGVEDSGATRAKDFGHCCSKSGRWVQGAILRVGRTTAASEFGIEARIFSVDGPQMIGRSHLEIPLQVREERQVRLG
jgi:hypothetical protein